MRYDVYGRKAGLELSYGPFDSIFAEVIGCLHAGLYQAAMTLALSLPDVCATLERPIAERRKQKGPHYIAWCERYLTPFYENVAAEEFWALRNGVMHSATLEGGGAAPAFDRVVLFVPNGARFGEISIENCAGKPGRTRGLQLETLCEHLIEAAQRWYGDKSSDSLVAASLDDIIRLRPDGEPYFKGVPILA